MRIALAVILVACSSPTKPTPVAVQPPPQPAPVTPAQDQDIPLPTPANGLAWDAADKALYIAADTKLLKWTSGTEFTPVADFPATGKLSLGGVVKLADGSFLVTSFGFGTDGTVFHVDAQHKVSAVPNLDPKRRRVGIAVGPDAAIYDAYFVMDGKDHTGGLAKLDLVKGETDVPLGTTLSKVVGVVATKRGVFISDQGANAIYAVGNATPIAKDLPSADMLAVLPDGALVTGGKNGVVSKVTLDGTITMLAQGYESVRGIAVDGEGKRLFVVEHGKDKHVLHIVKLP
ncbi:MAG: hypothetical protein QM831_08540 [Kofleriaceae bacterium]